MANATDTSPAFTARHRYARMAARKARLVADLIRGLSVNRALEELEFSPRRAAAYYLKVLRSAIANASQDASVDVNRLVVTDCRADDGPLLNDRMRWRPGPQGRAMPFRKRTSHLTVVVREAANEPAKGRP
jgi:large subunit ribosomal protein L22